MVRVSRCARACSARARVREVPNTLRAPLTVSLGAPEPVMSQLDLYRKCFETPFLDATSLVEREGGVCDVLMMEWECVHTVCAC
jgi:hypothetical protein